MLRKNLDSTQTIFALTTGSLPSAVAIIKVCGPTAFEMAAKLFVAKGEVFTRKRGVWFGELHDLEGKPIDEVVAVSFVGPHSHSGEDTVEFHCHGSIAIIRKLENELLLCGARPAERGEFSYRAMLNGKQSPSDLENLADVFQARQSVDLEKVYARKDGALAQKIADLRKQLIGLQAIFDTAVDFSEEYSSVTSHAGQGIRATIRECSEIIQRYSRFKSQENLPKIVLAGRPNAGKSSLFNALLGRYRAIVSPEAGTTRDVIEDEIILNAQRWKLVDTAGIHDSSNAIEQSGIELGENFLSGASLWILVVNGAEQSELSPREIALLEKFADKPHFIVWNKKDLAAWKSPVAWISSQCLSVSAMTAEGLEAIWNKLESEAQKVGVGMDGPLPTAVQSARLLEVTEDLMGLQKELEMGLPPEVLAEKNRYLVSKMERVVGQVEPEEVLGRIFSEFCIGK